MKPEKQLYQWDVNQYLTGINPSAQYVDYKIDNEVIRLETDGTRCRIPDEVLQTYGGKTCYERYPDGTYRAYSFTVLYAPKPPDYVFTPEERTTFEALTARVDAAIDEIKRRADSGEFTPVKGVDYFTNAEKAEMMESVSDGAIGEFRNVVDTATTEYNVNHTEKMTAYDTNASEKLTTYDTNAEQHTTDYNRNAEVKLEAYNSNHAAKVAEYNQNAETKTAEFDSNAAALQEQMAEKANVDGYYEEMTVGDAEQLIATQFVEDNEPYLFRPTGGPSDVGNRAYLDKIVGGTVAWNQLVPDSDRNYTNTSKTDTIDYFHFAIQSMTPSILYVTKVFHTAIGEYSVLFKPSSSSTGVRIKHSGKSTDLIMYFDGNMQITANHVYMFTANFKAIDVTTVEGVVVQDLQFFDLTQMFGSTIADYIYSLEQSQAGAGVAWFKKLFPKDYYEYNAGELLSVEGLQSHDTVGFNQWDEEWEKINVGISNGNTAPSTTTIGSKNFCPILPSTAYYATCGKTDGGSQNKYYLGLIFYDENKQYISGGYYNNLVFTTPEKARFFKITTNTGTVIYGNTYNHDICINLSDPSRNGEYEPYEKHSYPLDNSLTLRGIPKLDASNNLYYDGDGYEPDGTVSRRFRIDTYDGSEAWTKDADISVDGTTIHRFYLKNNSIKKYTDYIGRMLANKCETTNNYTYAPSMAGDFAVTGYSITSYNDNWMYIFSKTVDTVEGIKAWLVEKPLQVLYELATPTTETAEPFHNIQVVDDFGTEGFVSTGIVPVGHNTRYPANLRDKLQHLPDLAGMDGTYLIQQSGKQMSLIHMPAVFPEIPTEDGTYTLKTVVTGGVATLQWVVE